MTEESQISDSSSWWATVKYQKKYGDNIIEHVPVSKICVQWFSQKKMKWKKKSFSPENLTDFDKFKWYSVLSSKNVNFDEEAAFWALIGRIAKDETTLKKLYTEGRISWPNVADCGDEPPTDVESSSAEVGKSSQSVLQKNKRQRMETKVHKDTAKVALFDAFMQNTDLRLAEESPRNSVCDESEAEKQSMSSGDSIESLKAKIRMLEEQQKNSSFASSNSFEDNVMRGLNEIWSQQKSQGLELQSIRNSITSMQQELDEVKSSCGKHDEVLQKIQSDLTNTLTASTLSTVTSRSSTSSSLAPIRNDKVKWADNFDFTIRKASLDSMTTVVDITDWVIAFVCGVFEEEEIRNLVTRKRSNSGPHIKEIDKNLLLFARGEFRKWLEETGRYNRVELEYHASHFGSYVGDVCMSRRGPRGVHKKIKDARDAGGDVTGILAEVKASAAAAARARAERGEEPRTRHRLGRMKPVQRATPLAVVRPAPDAASAAPTSLAVANPVASAPDAFATLSAPPQELVLAFNEY